MSTVDFTSLKAKFQERRETRGLIAAVATRLQLSHEHVRQVAHGARESKRVAKALTAEWRKRQRSTEAELVRERAA